MCLIKDWKHGWKFKRMEWEERLSWQWEQPEQGTKVFQVCQKAQEAGVVRTQVWVHVYGKNVLRLDIWLGTGCGTQTWGFAVTLKGVPCNHSPKGCCLKLRVHGGQVRYGEAAILHSCKDWCTERHKDTDKSCRSKTCSTWLSAVFYKLFHKEPFTHWTSFPAGHTLGIYFEALGSCQRFEAQEWGISCVFSRDSF